MNHAVEPGTKKGITGRLGYPPSVDRCWQVVYLVFFSSISTFFSSILVVSAGFFVDFLVLALVFDLLTDLSLAILREPRLKGIKAERVIFQELLAHGGGNILATL